MKFNYVKTIGFRKFQNVFETKLYNITHITGKNRSGKSNLLYAIINVILGTNLTGDEKTCLINKKCDKSYAELHFTDNSGMDHIITRVKDRYSTRGNSITLDGKKITQDELVAFYKDKKLLLSILNPMYFITRKTVEQKEFVDKYLSDIKPKVIFDRLDKIQQQELLNKYYKDSRKYEELTQEEQENFINLHMHNICMDIVYNKLLEDEKVMLEGMPNDIPTYISELNNEIRKIESSITTLEGKIQYAENIVNTELPKRKNFDKDEELSLYKQELDFLDNKQDVIQKGILEKTIKQIDDNITLKTKEHKELTISLKAGKQKYNSIKNGAETYCPTCSQVLQDENKKIALNNMKNELLDKYKKSQTLEADIKNLNISLLTEKSNFYAITERIKNSSIENDSRISELKESIALLENEKAEIEKFNHEIEIRAKDIVNARNDIQKFNKEKQEYLKSIDNLTKTKKIAQKLYISYLEEKIKIAKEYLKDVDIRFYSVLKETGEVKPDFIITYKNTPLNDLSKSETTATALEFANMFNKISGVNLPMFIDDFESCVDYDFIERYSENTQVIVSKVEKGNVLKIADANSKEVTVIKPIIKGFRTMKKHIEHNKVA